MLGGGRAKVFEPGPLPVLRMLNQRLKLTGGAILVYHFCSPRP